MIVLHIIPFLGDLYAHDVVRQDLLDWSTWAASKRTLSGDMYADDTLESWARTLMVICKDMAADLDIPDPTRRFVRPRSGRRMVREKNTLTVVEIGRLVQAFGS